LRSKAEWKALLAAAQAGSRDAQFIVGCAYGEGARTASGAVVVTRDPARAAEWMERAARGGDPSAMHNIGYYYDRGVGVRRDARRALFWYRTVLRIHGYESAANNIATIYRDRKDHKRAFVWYCKAAEAGDGDALVEVAVRYLRGRGVRRDPERGVKQLRRAIKSTRITESGRDDAKYQLGLCYLRGTGVRMSVSRARKWLTEANRAGDHPEAVKALASLQQASWRSLLQRSTVSGRASLFPRRSLRPSRPSRQPAP
jgi:TPR repeat protein